MVSKRRIALAGITAAVVAAGLVTTVVARAATPACRVEYRVPSQWPGGFTGSVTVTNLGDPITGWQVTWAFTAGQQVTQAWYTNLTQSGAQVTAANPAWLPTLATGASANLGFNATWNGQNPAPSTFALNGTTCTGAAPSPTAGTTSPATNTTTTRPPASTTTTSRPPTTTTSTAPPAGPSTPPSSYPDPGRVTGDILVHDPTIVKATNGSYLVVHTGNNLPIKTSTDRVNFRNAGAVWPNGASWTTPYTAGGRSLWAPDISYRNGQYFLYYSASTFGSRRSAIFLATSPTGGSGTWTHQGLIIETNDSSNYNAIDPNLFVDPQGQWWLTFGSFWSGIKLIRLDAATGRRSTTDTVVRSLATRPSSVDGAIEAPTLHRRGDFYYLFASFDRCCQGAQSTYRIMVGRSTSVTGPFVDRNGVAMTAGGGTQILAGHGSIHGPGHQAVLTDTGGDVLVYHYYADDNSARLGINLLGWDAAGWPFVY